jgi:hypothetical protein
MSLGLESRFEVKDGAKTVTFEGWHLGSSSSHTPESLRWTELSLYKTLAGAYILEKVGRSDVFHTEDCPRTDRNGKPMSKGKRFVSLDDAMPDDAEEEDYLEDWFVPCPDCRPDYDAAPVYVERDIFSAPVHSNAERVVAALYQTKGANRFLSRIARDLLEQAVERDAALRAEVAKPVEIR